MGLASNCQAKIYKPEVLRRMTATDLITTAAVLYALVFALPALLWYCLAR